MSYQNSSYSYSSLEISTETENIRKKFSVPRIILYFISLILGLTLIFLSFFYKSNTNLRKEGVSTTIPFQQTIHPMSPSSYWGSVSLPYPTGAFWTNLVIDNGNQQQNSPVLVAPYGICNTNNGVQVSYGPTRRVVTQLAITDAFDVDMQLSSLEAINNWSVIRYDNLSVTTQFNTINGGTFTNYLVKSSPFVTVVYDNATPVISSDTMQFTSVQGQLVEGQSGTFYLITLGNYQNWFVYSSVPVSFMLQGNSLVAPLPLTGVIRIAFLPNQNVQSSFSMLAQYVQCYPTGADISISYNSDVTATVSFTYITEGPGPLLMLALPHHMDVIALPDDDALDLLRSTYTPIYSLKGKMTPIVGLTWNLIYDLLSVSWNYVIEQDLSISQLDIIASNLQTDVNTNLPDASDPYDFGKQIARLARLAFIADYLGIPDSRATAITNLENALTPWLTGTNVDAFLYDTTYGGIVTTLGIGSSSADYGNGWYNDHHFHYGYFVYAFAALVRFDPSYWLTYRPAMDSIMRDICANTGDAAFPFIRHKDFFDGHSWASGLFTEANAKNQESSSEVIF